MSETFYFSFLTGKIHTAAEVAGRRTLSGTRVPKPRKPAFAPTSPLVPHWSAVAVHALNEAAYLADLSGDDARDDLAAGYGVDSEDLGTAAYVFLVRIATAVEAGGESLDRIVAGESARLLHESRHRDAVLDWAVQSIRANVEYDWDSLDADDRRVLRYIAKEIGSHL